MRGFFSSQVKRVICAVCAVTLLVCTVFPSAAFAEQPGDTAAQSLSAEDAKDMAQADKAVRQLTGSDEYEAMTSAQRMDAALEQIESLAEQGLVKADSIYTDEENGMISFTYSCGVLGGVLVDDFDDDSETYQVQLEDMQKESESLSLDAQNNDENIGNVVIYYAFDNTLNSTRYPYYAYMQGVWTTLGVRTKLDTTVTVDDLRHMDDYDLCVLSAHGSYYTYATGFFFKKVQTSPVILLMERSNFYKDLLYGFDLLTHRIIKINGVYCITPSFFSNEYQNNKLAGTIVFSETCEFLGVDGSIDSSMADALVGGGAQAVVGFVNNVYAVYSRSMLWDTVNQLIIGNTIQQALDHAKSRYGSDDLVWYNSQGGKRPHSSAAYVQIYGSTDATLYWVPPYARAA